MKKLDQQDAASNDVADAARARLQVSNLLLDHAAAMAVANGHSRRAMLLAARLISLAADLENPAISSDERKVREKMVDDAECAAWGYKAPVRLAHDRVTSALEAAALAHRARKNASEDARWQFPDPEKLARYDLGQWYPERVDKISAEQLQTAIAKVGGRDGKTNAIAEITALLGFTVENPEDLRASTSAKRTARHGKKPKKSKKKRS